MEVAKMEAFFAFFTDLMEFLANIEKVFNEVFRIVGEIMKKVDAINAEDAE